MKIVHFDENGRRVLTYEELAAELGQTRSALRSRAHDLRLEPAGMVTGRDPAFYPEQFGLNPDDFRDVIMA